MQGIFPDFEFDANLNISMLEFCKGFVKKKFTDRIEDKNRKRYVYFTQATDTGSVRKIIKSIFDAWIKASLEAAGLV